MQAMTDEGKEVTRTVVRSMSDFVSDMRGGWL